MKPADILPTHQCFKDALDFLEQRISRNVCMAMTDELTLVHAIVLTPEDAEPSNQPYAHAWVEHDGLAWEAGLLDGERVFYSVPIPEYYLAYRPQDVTRYTVQTALEQHLACGNYGPWEERLLKVHDTCMREQNSQAYESAHRASLMNVRAFSGFQRF